MNFSNETVQNILQEFASPIYLYDVDAIQQRYENLNSAFNEQYPNTHIALSYKTCPLLGILKTLQDKGAMPEVVSEFECDMASLLKPDKMIINGPHKTDKMLAQAIEQEYIINIDHQQEIQRINTLSKQLGKITKVGIRLSLGDGWNRFGFEYNENLWSKISKIQDQQNNLKIVGVHVHVGTGIRDYKVFTNAANALAQALSNWPFDWPMEWVDLGGGLAGISPKWQEDIEQHELPCLESYAQAWLTPLKNILLKHKPLVIVEPGRTLFEPFAGLLTQVVTRRDSNDKNQSLVINGGINAVPTARVYRHPLHSQHTLAKTVTEKLSTNIYGPLCLQADTLAKNTPLNKMQSGDWIIIQGVGAYNQSRSVPFIQTRPGVAGLIDGHWQWLRHHETVNDHLKLEVWG